MRMRQQWPAPAPRHQLIASPASPPAINRSINLLIVSPASPPAINQSINQLIVSPASPPATNQSINLLIVSPDSPTLINQSPVPCFYRKSKDLGCDSINSARIQKNG
jgi:hypothetical protein